MDAAAGATRVVTGFGLLPRLVRICWPTEVALNGTYSLEAYWMGLGLIPKEAKVDEPGWLTNPSQQERRANHERIDRQAAAR